MPIPRVTDAPPDLAGRRVGVLGAARSGVGCARLLAEAGATVVVGDAKSATDLDPDCTRQIIRTGAELRAELTQLGQLGDLDLVVLSPGVRVDAPIVVQAKAAGLDVIGEVELAYRFSRAPVIAIAGTNAKGTTCTLLGGMLNTGGVPARVCGNIGDPFSGAVAEGREVALYVVEVSSFQLETADRFRPWVAVLLNIEPDHLDRHPSFEAYVGAKARLFENQTPADWAIVNAEDPDVLHAAASTQAHHIAFSAASATAPARVEDDALIVDVGHGPTRVCHTGDLIRAGRPYIESVLAASAAALIAGAIPEGILRAIRTHRLPDHVLDVVCEANGVTFINSSKATNPAAARADLESVDGPLIVIAGGLEKKADFTDFGQFLRQRARALLVIGECAERIADAAEGIGVTQCRTLEEAIERAYQIASPGDKVVLAPACASWDMFPNYKARGDCFRRAAQGICQVDPGGKHQSSGGMGQT